MKTHTIVIPFLIALTSLLFALILVTLYTLLDPHVTVAVTEKSAIAGIEAEDPRMIFVGDVMMARDVENVMRRYGSTYPFSFMQPFLNAPVVVGNFEASIPLIHVPTKSMQMRFSVDESFIPALAASGFTHLSLANNHAYDYGAEGYAHTTSILKDAALVPFGHPYSHTASSSIAYTKMGNHSVALMGLYAVVSTPDTETLEELVDRAAEESDLQIAYVHFGDEYILTHNEAQEELAHTLIDLGVDIVVGHHPHVVQDIESYGNGLIFYSLGNFVFDQYFSRDVQQGLMLEIAGGVGDVFMITLFPISTELSRTAPQLLSGHEHDAFLESLATRSDSSLSSYIESGVIPFILRR